MVHRTASLPIDPDDVDTLAAVVVQRAEEPVADRFDDETLVFDPASGRMSQLNAVGTFLWERLDEPVSAESLSRALVDRFGIDDQRARTDVFTYLRALVERGWVRVVDR